MDNEASTTLDLTMTFMNIKYQLFTPINHRSNNADRAIKKFKKHFIAGLCSVDKEFNLQLWDILLKQATRTAGF